MKLFPGKIYSVYLVKEFIKVFLTTLLFIVALSFIVRTLQGLDKLKEYTLLQVFIMRVLEAPEIISREALLASCIFSSVYTVSNISKNREVLALRSCGVSKYRILMPLIFVGLVIGAGSHFFEDYVVIRSFDWKARYKAKLRGEQLVKNELVDRYDIIVFGQHNSIYKIDRYEAKNRIMHGVMIISRGEAGRIVMRIDAEKGVWDGSRWVFINGIMRRFDNSGKIVYEKLFERYRSDLEDNPDYFARKRRKIENMPVGEGIKYVKALQRMGLNYKGYLTRLYRKIGQPYTLFVVIIIGLAIGSIPFRNALVISFAITLMIVLCFFFVIEVGYTFGSTGKLPPILGGWLGNIIFSVLGIYLLIRIRG